MIPHIARPTDTEAIWHQMRDALGQFIRRRVTDPAVAEDLLQDTFLRIHQGLQQQDDIQNLSAWIYQIARNLIVDYYRGQQRWRIRTRPLDEDADVPEQIDRESGESERAAAIEELTQCLRPMVNALPDLYRQAITLTDLDGFTQVEAAKQLGISTPGAKSRVQRARRKLKHLLLECCQIERDARGGLGRARPRASCCGPQTPGATGICHCPVCDNRTAGKEKRGER